MAEREKERMTHDRASTGDLLDIKLSVYLRHAHTRDSRACRTRDRRAHGCYPHIIGIETEVRRQEANKNLSDAVL